MEKFEFKVGDPKTTVMLNGRLADAARKIATKKGLSLGRYIGELIIKALENGSN